MARSYLFTPAHQERLLTRAHERGADVVLLDLEDSVPPDKKSVARSGLAQAVAGLVAHGVQVAVRVNSGLSELARDIEAVCLPGVQAVMVPKVANPDRLRLIAEALTLREAQAGLARPIALIALVETAEGLLNAPMIARAPRLSALAFGTEDFSADLGISPTPEALAAYAQQLILAAKAAGVPALGLPGSIADVADIARFHDVATLGQRLGFEGALCVHPRQVEIVNRLYNPSVEALIYAARIIEAYEAASVNGQGAVLLDGKMVDPPVVARALRLLRQSPGRTDHA